MELDSDNIAQVTKSRCSSLSGQRITRPGVDIGQEIAVWLRGAELAGPDATQHVAQWFADIPDKDRRRQLKDEFMRRFGAPDRLLAEQLEAVHAWMTTTNPPPPPAPREPDPLEAPFT